LHSKYGLPIASKILHLRLIKPKPITMKKLLTIAVLATCMAACNDSKKDGTVTTTLDSTATQSTGSTTGSREKEIADSTKMLDKKLADSSSTMTPDSLK
jgi:hypothetical protein